MIGECLQVLNKENQMGHTLHSIMVLYLLFLSPRLELLKSRDSVFFLYSQHLVLLLLFSNSVMSDSL